MRDLKQLRRNSDINQHRHKINGSYLFANRTNDKGYEMEAIRHITYKLHVTEKRHQRASARCKTAQTFKKRLRKQLQEM